MKKSILNLGKTLNKVEQKEIYGGVPSNSTPDCGSTGGTYVNETLGRCYQLGGQYSTRGCFLCF